MDIVLHVPFALIEEGINHVHLLHVQPALFIIDLVYIDEFNHDVGKGLKYEHNDDAQRIRGVPLAQVAQNKHLSERG